MANFFTELFRSAVGRPAGVFNEALNDAADWTWDRLGVDTSAADPYTTILNQEDKARYDEDPLREISKATAVAGSYAIPAGKAANILGYAAKGAIPGAMSGYGMSAPGDELRDTGLGAVTGALTSGAGYFADLARGSQFPGVLDYNVRELPFVDGMPGGTSTRGLNIESSLPREGFIGSEPMSRLAAEGYSNSMAPMYTYKAALENALPAQRGNLMKEWGYPVFNYMGKNYTFNGGRTYQDLTSELLPFIRTIAQEGFKSNRGN